MWNKVKLHEKIYHPNKISALHALTVNTKIQSSDILTAMYLRGLGSVIAEN